MPGKPFQSSLIPYLDEITELRRKKPPVSYARIAEILYQKHGLSIQRSTIGKFVKVRSKGRKVYFFKEEPVAKSILAITTKPKTLQTPEPAVAGKPKPMIPDNPNQLVESQPARTFEMPFSETYNLTRVSPEEAAARLKKLEEKEKQR